MEASGHPKTSSTGLHAGFGDILGYPRDAGIGYFLEDFRVCSRAYTPWAHLGVDCERRPSMHHAHALTSHSFPGNSSICTILHHVRITCALSDRTIPREIMGSAQLRVKCRSTAHAWIALFPWKYVYPHKFASNAHQVRTSGSYSSPGNTSIRATLHPVQGKCAHSDRALSRGILQSTQLCIVCTSSAHARIALFPWK